MARLPTPSRTKRGKGAGAKLTLSIDYYRSPEGEGSDFGFLHGRDDYGTWEAPFANREELARTLASIVESMYEVATRAREDSHARSTGRTVWLKAVGAQGWPIEEVWWEGDDLVVDFPFRPKSIRPGDLMVIYAAGKGVLVGVAEVVGDWYRADREERWPWAVDAAILSARPVSQGIPLDVLTDEREIGKSIRQKSHIRLSNGEAATALAAFGVKDE